jgi:hypothetical protein
MASVARMMDSVTRLRSELSLPASSQLPSLKGAVPTADPEKEALSTEVQSLKDDLDRRQVGCLRVVPPPHLQLL